MKTSILMGQKSTAHIFFGQNPVWSIGEYRTMAGADAPGSLCRRGRGKRRVFLHVCFNPVLKFSSLRSLIRATRIAVGHSCFWLTLARRVFFDFPICCHVVFRTHYDGSARILWEGFVTWSWTILTLDPKQISQPKVGLAHRKVQGLGA